MATHQTLKIEIRAGSGGLGRGECTMRVLLSSAIKFEDCTWAHAMNFCRLRDARLQTAVSSALLYLLKK
jgi:hypothetical protein